MVNHTGDVQPSDEKLVAMAKLQLPYQTTAYEQLMRRHRSRLYFLCLRIVRHGDDAEDITQDVMLKAFHGISKFSGDSKFSTWLYTVASNACLDYLRRKKLQMRHFEEMGEGNEPFYLSDSDDRVAAEKALATLNDRDRTMMALYYTTGMTLEEIATVMGMKQSAAKMCYYRALQKLRKRFGLKPEE